MPAASQRGHGDGRDIAAVDHRDPSVTGRGGDRAVVHHAEQVLHDEHRANDRGGKAGLRKRPLGLPVLARDLQG